MLRELPFPSQGDLPNPGIEPTPPALAGELFTTEPAGKPEAKVKRSLGEKEKWGLPATGPADLFCKEPAAQVSSGFFFWPNNSQKGGDSTPLLSRQLCGSEPGSGWLSSLLAAHEQKSRYQGLLSPGDPGEEAAPPSWQLLGPGACRTKDPFPALGPL